MNKTTLAAAVEALTPRLSKDVDDDYVNIERLAVLAKMNDLPQLIVDAMTPFDHDKMQELIDFYSDVLVGAVLEQLHNEGRIDLNEYFDD